MRGDLEDWGKKVKKRPEAGRAEAKVRRPWKKILLVIAAAVVLLLVVVIALAPTIASSVAPGQIESAAAAQVKGKVKVKSVSLGWFSATEVDSLEVIDPEGKTAATVSVKTPATLWKVISERWWSASRLDVGEVEVSGSVDIVRDAVTGVTNLQRALELKVPPATGSAAKPAPSGGSGGGMESVKGVLRLTRFDATVREKDAAGKLSAEQGVKGLKGAVTLDYAASPTAFAAVVDLVGSPVGVGADAGGDVKVKVDATVKPKVGGGLESFKCRADVVGLPVQIVDAMARQGGALVGALGARAEVHVDASGSPTSADAKVGLASPGTTLDMMLTLRDGVLSSAPGGKVVVKSTEFAASLPALRESMGLAAKQVKLDKAPGLEIAIEKLRWPVPAGLLDGSAGASAMSAADFRGGGVELKVHVDGMSGKVAMGEEPQPIASAGWKAFAVQPIDLVVSAGDLSKAVTVSGGTKATLDGAAAGDFSVRASASGLLDAAGHLRALAKNAGGIADELSAEVKVDGASTALLQPVVTASGLPVDMKVDVGPTLSATASVRADVKGVDVAAGGTPPVDFVANIASSNVKVDATGRFERGVVRTTGEGVKVNVATASGLAQRLMSKPGQPAAIEISGAGALTITVKDFAAPVDQLKGVQALGVVKGLVGVEVSGLAVRPAMQAPAGKAPAPVEVSKAVLGVNLDGVNPPQLDINAAMSHDKSPFALLGQIKLEGIKGKLPDNAGAGAAQIIAFKPTGRIELKDVPRSVAVFVPGAEMVGQEPSGTEMPAQITRALRESIGNSATVVVTTQPEGLAQATGIKLTTSAGGVSAEVATKLTEKAMTVSTLEAGLAMKPEIVNPVLASAKMSGSESRTAQPLKLAQPFKLSLKSDTAITVPLKAGTFEPDFAGASDATVSLATDNDIAIDNVPLGADASGAAKTTGVRVKSLKAEVKAPLSGLSPEGKGKRFAATFSTIAAKSEGNATIADVSGTLSAAMDDSTPPQAEVSLKSIDTAVVESLIGKPGLLTGALGDKAEAELKVRPTKDGQSIAASLTAPKVSDAKIELVQSADRMAITKPAVITWKPDAASLNKLLFPPAAAGAGGGKASAVTVTSAAPITVTIQKLAIASTQTVNGATTGGPLKPGVFALEASIVTPSLGLTAAGSGGNAPPTVMTLSGISASVKHQPAAQGFGELLADIAIDRVSGGSGDGAKKSAASVRIANIADANGVLTPKSAVVNLDADLVAFPMPIVDSLANQKGMLAELLGSTVDLQAKAVNVSLGAGSDAKAAAGTLQVKAKSPRASAEIVGDIRGGAFVQTGPVNVRLLQISPQMVKMLGEDAIPMVTSVEKSLQDEPGKFDGLKLSVPLDNDMTKLNGDLTIDPGVVQFQTKSIFGTLIEGLGGKGSGSLGNRLEPVKIHAEKGVLTYQQFKLPVGQFNLETRGTVDLVRKNVDVITYAPIGALTSKAVGDLNTGIAGKLGLFDKNTMVPITTKGAFGATETKLDLGLFAKEQADKLLKNPGKLIENVIGDVLGGGKKPPAAPPGK